LNQQQRGILEKRFWNNMADQLPWTLRSYSQRQTSDTSPGDPGASAYLSQCVEEAEQFVKDSHDIEVDKPGKQ